MVGKVIGSIILFLVASLFVGIAIYALKSNKPIHFYSGTSIDPKTIKDIKKYNKENAYMWISYSLWYFISIPFIFINPTLSLIILLLSASLGFILLIRIYKKIYNKYKIKGE